MKIETQQLEDHQVKLVVEVEPEPLEQAKRRAARQIAKRTKIPGFRPGKAPYHIVQRFVGEEAILEDGLDILVQDLYPEVIKEAEIQPYGPGKLDKIASSEPLTLEFVVPLAPEVEMGDYRSVRIPYELEEVGETEIEAALDNLRQRQAIEEPAERPAQEGDHVFIRISATRLDPEEGADPTLINERQYSAIIEPQAGGDEQAWPFPGFSRQLIGLSAGEEKTLTYTFPHDSDYESLRGATGEFHIAVEEVKSRSLPELDDDFARSVGEYDDLAALRADIRKQLEEAAREEYHAGYNEKVIEALVDDATIKYPPQLLEDEINEVIHQLENRLKSQNLDLETYLKTRELDQAALREEARPAAETRLKRSLVLLDVARIEDIQVDKDELQAETERTIEAMTRFMSESELRKIPQDQLIPNLVGNIMAEMRVARTREFLRAIARGEEPPKQPEADVEVSVAEGETPAVEEGEALSGREEPPSASAEQPAGEPEDPASAGSGEPESPA